MKSGLLGLAATLALATSALAAPPSLPANIGPIAQRLTSSFNSHDVAAYGALFSDKVQVFYERKLAFKNKSEWLTRISNGFRDRRQHVQPIKVAVGGNRIIVLELYEDHSREPDEAIPVPRVAAYSLADGKIIEVQFIDGVSYFVDAPK